MSTPFLSIKQLQRALAIEEKIYALRVELAQILTSPEGTPKASSSGDGRPVKRSAATRAKMAAAQRARWAKARDEARAPVPARKKRQMSAEGRARIVAAQKKRWAAVKS